MDVEQETWKRVPKPTEDEKEEAEAIGYLKEYDELLTKPMLTRDEMDRSYYLAGPQGKLSKTSDFVWVKTIFKYELTGYREGAPSYNAYFPMAASFEWTDTHIRAILKLSKQEWFNPLYISIDPWNRGLKLYYDQYSMSIYDKPNYMVPDTRFFMDWGKSLAAGIPSTESIRSYHFEHAKTLIEMSSIIGLEFDPTYAQQSDLQRYRAQYQKILDSIYREKIHFRVPVNTALDDDTVRLAIRECARLIALNANDLMHSLKWLRVVWLVKPIFLPPGEEEQLSSFVRAVEYMELGPTDKGDAARRDKRFDTFLLTFLFAFSKDIFDIIPVIKTLVVEVNNRRRYKGFLGGD